VVLVTIGAVRVNFIVFYAFIIISFLNRCLNPFIYASQYKVLRRVWIPLTEFLRDHVVGKLATKPVTLVSSGSHPAGRRQAPLSLSKVIGD